MNSRDSTGSQCLTQDTLDSLRELVHDLRESCGDLGEAASLLVEDDHLSKSLWTIAKDRKRLDENFIRLISLPKMMEAQPSHFYDGRSSLRSRRQFQPEELNAEAILSELCELENSVVSKFSDVLPQVAGSPINDVLMAYYQPVCEGRDLVCGLRENMTVMP